LRLFLVRDCLEQFGHGKWLQVGIGFSQNRTIRTNRHGRAQSLLTLCDTTGHRDHFGRLPGFLETHRFFDSNLVKGIHGHFDIGDIDARAIGFHAYLDVVIDHALDWNQYLHGSPWELIDVNVNCDYR